MTTEFLHGVEVVEVDVGPRPIRTLKSNVIGLVGTALIGPVNVPTLITTRREGVATFGADFGTIPDALDAIFDHAGATVVVVNVLDPTTHTRAAAAVLETFGNDDTITLPGPYPVSSVVVKATTEIKGVPRASGEALSADTQYALDAATGTLTRATPDSGALTRDARYHIAYHVPDEADADLVTAVKGGVDAGTGAYTGAHALLAAESVVHVQPRILVAPGYTGTPSDAGGAGPVLAELYGIADRLRAVIIADGPSTTDAKAITFRKSIGSRRVYIVDPHVKVWDDAANAETIAPGCARVAGLIAKSDAERGFWWSPSNRPVYGIVGTERPVDFALGDPNARANQLNRNEVATIIRQDGYRLWGNRTCASDPRWAFLSVVRTADMINDSLLRAHLWAVDRCIGRTYLDAVVDGVNAYLRDLKTLGAILGGACWVDPELNSKSRISQGKVAFDFDFTPCYPAERVTFRSRLVNDYIEEIFT